MGGSGLIVGWLGVRGERSATGHLEHGATDGRRGTSLLLVVELFGESLVHDVGIYASLSANFRSPPSCVVQCIA